MVASQTLFHPLKEVPLSGAEFVPDAKSLNLEYWMEGEYQRITDARIAKTFAFRSAFVRLFNQLRYTVFGEHTPLITMGKDGYLFETSYRASICGMDFLGDDEIQKKIDSLDVFRNRLLAKNIKLVILIAPNKWRTLKSKVQWNCKPAQTNYKALVSELKHRGYAVADAIELFRYEQENDPVFPLHSKQGTHWSVYGAARSAQYLQMVCKQEGINLLDFEIREMDIDQKPRYTDRDLHDLLNIMTGPESEALAYPKITFESGFKPRVTVVGDSYYFTYFYLNLHRELFSMDSKFFYYNRSMIHHDVNQRLELTDEIRASEIAASDLVLLVMSEPSLKWFGYGILDDYPK